MIGGSAPRICPSSMGLSLQAQPAPWLYSVSRISETLSIRWLVSNDPDTAVAPMDWGVLIPLWFMGGRQQPPVRIVVVTPARDLSASDHVSAGAAIAAVAAASDRRIALIASADHGHAHLGSGP